MSDLKLLLVFKKPGTWIPLFFIIGTCLFIVLFILSIVFAIVMGALIVSWWIGELVIFANNERMTGSGCFLRENL